MHLDEAPHTHKNDIKTAILPPAQREWALQRRAVGKCRYSVYTAVGWAQFCHDSKLAVDVWL